MIFEELKRVQMEARGRRRRRRGSHYTRSEDDVGSIVAFALSDFSGAAIQATGRGVVH